ncbi:MAG TPA: hypothetical protein VD788_01810, partial [Candidatus Polarisedimenticolaceae bacterium]|nr:hypothetical protein [Candidatus Polarisedimenticolaceae bacterium]
MSGFCGWVGLEASPEPGRHDLERMARWLNRFDGTVVDEFVDRSVAVASASLTGRPALARHADLVAVLEGEPRFADADLDAEARRRGAAAAMLLGYRKH